MRYQVNVSLRARTERSHAFDWYTENYSPEFALRWLDGVTRAMFSLADNPQRCAKAFESGRLPIEVRELLCGGKRNKHRILFEIVGDEVVILQIRHSAQKDLTIEDL